MSTADQQKRLDDLIEDLGLSIDERAWIHGRWKTDRVARRVVNLIDEAVRERPFDKRQVLLRHLFDAVKDVRASMAAETFVTPDGYTVVRENVLEVLRELAMVQALLEDIGPTDPSRHGLASRRAAVGRMVLNVDPVVSQMLEGQA